MTKMRNKTQDAQQVKQLIVGTNKLYPDASESLSVAGTTFTVASLTALMQAFVDQRQAVEDAKAALRAKLDVERTQGASQLAVIRAFEAIVRASSGNAADVLASCGFAPPKVRVPLTAEQKAVAVAKRKATRVARNTLGKNQKKAIKGSIEAKLVVTPATPAAPVSPTPATPPVPPPHSA